MNLRFLPFLLGLAILAACVETDIAVPSFPGMVAFFGATEAQVQLTMSLNFLGFCLAGLIHGPLSESFGRRRVMLVGSFIFLVGAIGSATAGSINTLIAWRFFQGTGAAAACVVVFAMVADVYSGEKASRLISMLNASLTAAMAAAPMLGGYLADSYGWRSAYTFVAVLCSICTVLLIAFLPETRAVEEREPFDVRLIAKDYWRLLTSRSFMALTMVPVLLCAGYFAYVAGAVFFYVNYLEVPLREFTFHQGTVIAMFSIVSFVSGRINQAVGASNAVLGGTAFTLLGGAGLLVLALADVRLAVAFTSVMSLFAIGVALCFGATFAASMEIHPDIRGAASSMNMALRLVFIAATIWAVGAWSDGTFLPSATLILTSALASLLMVVPVFLYKETRALLV